MRWPSLRLLTGMGITVTTITATITDIEAMPRVMRPAPPLPASSLLQLIWLASPALPVGGFSYSEGLEAAIDGAGIASEPAVSDWLADQLHLALARADLAVVAQAVPAWRRSDAARIRALNDW